MRIRTVCASSVFLGQEAFSTLGDVIVLPDRDIDAAALCSADALVIRSKTHVDKALLNGSRVSFVGTATAGFDHIEIGDLDEARIAWVSSPGCNANSVAEYVLSALLALSVRHHRSLADCTIGIIGVGNVGRRVARVAEIMGMRVLRNDPPLAAATGDAAYLPLADVIGASDIVTLHVPLTDTGPYPTRHLADHRFFAAMKAGGIFINTARGEVVDPEALLLAMSRDVVRHAILDVWDGEPYYRSDLLDRVDIGTSHIAGYSVEGKLAGTISVYRDACHFFETPPTWDPPAISDIDPPVVYVDARGLSDEEVLWQLVRSVYDVWRDDAALRSGSRENDNARAAHFTRLRIDYPIRRELSSARVRVEHASPELLNKIGFLGFRVESP